MKNHFLKTALLTLTLSVAAVSQSYSFETTAKTATLLDVQTGDIIYSKNSDTPLPPSSMSKLMTAYMLLDAIKDGQVTLDQEVVVSEHAGQKSLEMQREGGSTMYLKAGDMVKVDELLKGVIIASANEACVVIAELVSGSEEQFAIDANKKAEEIGMTGSNIVNASGWPVPDHLMTSHDLAVLGMRLQKDFPDHFEYFSKKSFEFKTSSAPFINRNKLLWLDKSATGLKTGHTTVGGYGMTASFDRGGRKLVAVMNGMTLEANGSARKNIERSKRLKEFADWGYATTENYKFFTAGQTVLEAPVWYGKKATAELTTSEDIVLTLQKGGYKNVDFIAYYLGPINAGVKKGEVIGELSIEKEGKVLKTFDLVAKEDIKAAGILGKFLNNIKNLF
ncbi:MAG: D-alanyl-D-alanine carboxypeptidase [Alphaproteobacteria bacterium]|jgi:D-alanyl-D-alanine carboxypeptidase (penicillin-binding protein 5/6)|nr:D-alanyl-D-alanine carboxypeptidase [Alphaproteobacteria bacterium]